MDLSGSTTTSCVSGVTGGCGAVCIPHAFRASLKASIAISSGRCKCEVSRSTRLARLLRSLGDNRGMSERPICDDDNVGEGKASSLTNGCVRIDLSSRRL